MLSFILIVSEAVFCRYVSLLNLTGFSNVWGWFRCPMLTQLQSTLEKQRMMCLLCTFHHQCSTCCCLFWLLYLNTSVHSGRSLYTLLSWRLEVPPRRCDRNILMRILYFKKILAVNKPSFVLFVVLFFLKATLTFTVIITLYRIYSFSYSRSSQNSFHAASVELFIGKGNQNFIAKI